MTGYRTLGAFGEDEVVIQKSRFIGWAAPCADEKAALDLIANAKGRYREARHHCYAYIIGANQGIMRYSDDGEPGGTAGLPIIETMKQRGVTDCCVVVTRYFGGILLGTGGLTRAYRTGCRIALDAAGVVDMIPSAEYLCEVDYGLWDRVRHEMAQSPAEMGETAFTDRVSFAFAVREADEKNVLDLLTRATNGRADLIETGRPIRAWQAADEPAEE